MIDSGFAMPRPPASGAIAARGIAASQRVHPAGSPSCRGAAVRRCGALCAIAFALAAGEAAAAPPTLAGCPVFPADHVWNVAVDTLPADANSAAYVATIGTGSYVHPDFGTVYAGAPNGIPYVVVDATQPPVAVTFDYDDESDPGPYPIPPTAPIEGGPQSGGDRHVLVVDRAACRLYELFAAYPNGNGSWHAGSGAVYDLRGYALRPSTWTSADAAGLPMLPGLVRYDEVAAGEIAHALRFTAPQTRNAFIWPARHEASSLTGSAYPPMGQRFRMKASVDISKFGPNVQVILRALKKYGMFLADNGSSWYLSGAPDPRWSDDELHQIQQLHGSDFEAVDETSLIVDANSARAATGAASPVAIEFYRAAADHYFISADPAEILKLDTGVQPGWTRTGQAFAVYPASGQHAAQSLAGVPLLRAARGRPRFAFLFGVAGGVPGGHRPLFERVDLRIRRRFRGLAAQSGGRELRGGHSPPLPAVQQSRGRQSPLYDVACHPGADGRGRLDRGGLRPARCRDVRAGRVIPIAPSGSLGSFIDVQRAV